MDEIRISSFNQLGSATRDELIDCFGGDGDLASAFWEEVELIVASARKYGFTLQSTRKKASNRRHGNDLHRHMGDVAKASRALRVLLDADTLSHLALPPTDALFAVDQIKNIDRVRTIKRLLAELESEIKSADWNDVSPFRLTRLDYYLCRAVPSMLRHSERGNAFFNQHRRLLRLIFGDLGIGTSVDEAIKGASRHK